MPRVRITTVRMFCATSAWRRLLYRTKLVRCLNSDPLQSRYVVGKLICWMSSEQRWTEKQNIDYLRFSRSWKEPCSIKSRMFNRRLSSVIFNSLLRDLLVAWFSRLSCGWSWVRALNAFDSSATWKINWHQSLQRDEPLMVSVVDFVLIKAK